MSHTIHLPITARWFDHIVFGVDGDFKEEECRALTSRYAATFLCKTDANMAKIWISQGKEEKLKKFRSVTKFGKTTVTLTNGYNPTSRRAEIELLGLEIKTPNPKWVPEGTEGLYFALKLGELLRFGTVEMFKQEDQNSAS